MEEDAEYDEDVAKVVEGTNGDPDLIRENVSAHRPHAWALLAQ